MSTSNYHQSVLLNETIDLVPKKDNATYVDCTLGMGGHTKTLLRTLTSPCTLIGFDKDTFAIDNFKNQLDEFGEHRIILLHDDFKNLKEALSKLGINAVDGIIFDLGVSSPQLDNPERGFSYHHDAMLDMRMNCNQEKSALTVVNEYSCEALSKIFKEYGESRYATVVAQAICRAREIQPINTTLQLVDVIKKALPVKELYQDKHPAKVFFQAIRIEVNQELETLACALKDAANLLKEGGRLLVISFHSLEDKIVKQVFKELTTSKIPSYIPTASDDVLFKYVAKIQPSAAELQNNGRARSAKLRVIERKVKDEK